VKIISGYKEERKMDKEKLAEIILEFNEDLELTLKYLEKEITYTNELMILNKKHNRSNYELENKIKELEAKKDVVIDIKYEFNETLQGERTTIEEIKKLSD
jgi:phage shock protein A